MVPLRNALGFLCSRPLCMLCCAVLEIARWGEEVSLIELMPLPCFRAGRRRPAALAVSAERALG
eukprot:13412607-Alexandrium_andersonii.AAC.2